jgi:hypothetical protein
MKKLNSISALRFASACLFLSALNSACGPHSESKSKSNHDSDSQATLGRRSASAPLSSGIRGNNLKRAYNVADPVGRLKKSTIAITYKGKVACSGVAISPNHILTVIDCFWAFSGNDIAVGNSLGNSVPVLGNYIQLKPPFNRKSADANKVAGKPRLKILTVRNLPEGTEFTPIHDPFGTIHAGHIVQVGGFGKWDSSQSEGTLNFKEHTYCNPAENGDSQEESADKLIIRSRGSFPTTCTKDAGGPIFSHTLKQWTVVGLSVSRNDCAEQFSTGIDLRFHHDWIAKAIEHSAIHGLNTKTYLPYYRYLGAFAQKGVYGKTLGVTLGNKVPLNLEDKNFCPLSTTNAVQFPK